MRLDFLYTTHTTNSKTFVIAATAVVVNIIIVFFQSQQNTTKATKQEYLHQQYESEQKHLFNFDKVYTSFLCLHVSIYFSNDKSKKLQRYEMKWPIVLQIYILWPLPPSFFTSLLMSTSQWVH